MNVLDLCNPVVTSEVILKSFLEMDQQEYDRLRKQTLAKAEKFLSFDDSAFSASLDISEATSYANLVRIFLKKFKEFKDSSPKRESSAVYHAQTIAWWQVLSTFRTLHGKPSLDED